MHVVLQMDRHLQVAEVGWWWWVLVPEYRHKGKIDFVGCGPYKVPDVLKKGENAKLDISAPFDGLSVINRDSIKPYIDREVQPACQLWRLPSTC